MYGNEKIVKKRPLRHQFLREETPVLLKQRDSENNKGKIEEPRNYGGTEKRMR